MNKTKGKYLVKGADISDLEDFFEELGEKKFRARQLYNWIYNHLATDFDEMLNLSKTLREKLKERAALTALEKTGIEDSDATGVKKYLFKTYDGRYIESVLIPEGRRNTLCISTQVGCPLDCKFCATGLMGYKRNLSAGEITDQYLHAAREAGKENITNIVYMGMGEPLLNFDNTLKSLKIFAGEETTGLSRNRITVSTAGIPPKIKKLADSGLRVKLALSLHSCFEDTRSLIMPINKKYSLEENINVLKEYAKATKTRITFEYTMLKGLNDGDEDIKALARLCSSMPSKINIIPFNSIKHMDPDGFSGQLEPTPMNRISEFADALRNKNITVMLRDTQGDDIAAACGQLASKEV